MKPKKQEVSIPQTGKLDNEVVLEVVFLFLIVGVLLWTGIGGIWGHKIEHPYPWGYFATDAFQHQTRADWIKDAGNYQYEGFYYSSNFKDIVGFYPPILNHASVLLSHLSGLEVYDTIQILIFLAAVFGTLMMYLILRDYNKKLAILSMPLVVFLFAVQGSRIGWLWGHWPSLIGNLFLIAYCWALFKIDIKKSWLLIGLFLAGTAMGHTALTVFAGLFTIIFLAHKYFTKNLKKSEIKTIFAAGIFFLIVTAYFLNIFWQTWMKIQPYQFSVVTTNPGFGPIFSIFDFSYALPFLAVGLLVAIFMLRKSGGKLALFGLSMLLFGYTNYIGFDRRAWNLRFFWPIMLSVLFGLGLYYIVTKIKNDLNTKHAIAISAVLGGILMAFMAGNYMTSEQSGIMNSYVWDTLTWIKDNTPKDTVVGYFYGDAYDQLALVANSKRNSVRVQPEDLIQSLQEGKVKRVYNTWLYSEYGAGLPYSNGFLSYGLRSREDLSLTSDKPTDICSLQYYVFDKASRIAPLAQYNMLVANIMLNHTQFKVVHQNDLSVILQNNKPGAECIA